MTRIRASLQRCRIRPIIALQGDGIELLYGPTASVARSQVPLIHLSAKQERFRLIRSERLPKMLFRSVGTTGLDPMFVRHIQHMKLRGIHIHAHSPPSLLWRRIPALYHHQLLSPISLPGGRHNLFLMVLEQVRRLYDFAVVGDVVS